MTGDVHGVDEAESLADAALAHKAFDGGRDVFEAAPAGNVKTRDVR
jgi:hypothetical protein